MVATHRTDGPLRTGLLLLLAWAAAGIGSATAQDPERPVTGTWDVRWAQAVRTSGGEILEIQRWGDAVLTLAEDGDGLTGTWRTSLGVTWRVTGTSEGARLRLTAREHDSDDPALDVVRALHWEGVVTGDRVEGEMWLEFEGRAREPARRPWRGERRPAGRDTVPDPGPTPRPERPPPG